MMRKFNKQYEFKVLYPKMQPLEELHSELDKVIKKVGKVSNLSKSCTMSIVTK